MTYHDEVPMGLDVRETIAAEHEQIHKVLRELDYPARPARLPLLLAGLGALLRRHFEREVGPGGLYDVLRAKAPGRVDTLAELLAEHDELLAMIDDLARRADGAAVDLGEEVAACCARVRRHEACETQLMIDTLSRTCVPA